MNTKTPTQLYDELMALIVAGYESKAKEFLTENFDQFPEDVQEKMTMLFFNEAVLAEANRIEGTAIVQKESIDVLEKIESNIHNLEDQVKIQDIKESIG